MADRPLWIAGKRLRTSRLEPIRDPYTGRIVGRVFCASAREADRAGEAAREAFAATAGLPSHARAGILEEAASAIVRRRKELVRAIVSECGKPLRLAEMEVDRATFTFRLGAQEAVRIGGEVLPTDLAPRGEGYVTVSRRVPVGPVLAITPFNFPLNLMAHKVAPAIAAGCPVVLKPPPQAPGCALLLAEILRETAWPARAFQVVYCANDVAERMVRDDRYALLSFTGSARVGWHLKGIAGRKRVVLELGGNAGMLVEPDADLDRAVARGVSGAFAYAGQTCISVQRVLVRDRLYKPFLKRFVEAARAYPSGDPRSRRVENGPVIDAAAAERILSWIGEARARGAKILAGGGRLRGHRNVIAPTVIAEASRDLRVCCEEVFGPVVVLDRVRSFEEGILRLDDTRYGLQAAVFTRDVRRIAEASRALRVGGLIVNDAPTFRMDNAPYGGTRESGLGREGVRPAIEEMTEPRLLVIYTG